MSTKPSSAPRPQAKKSPLKKSDEYTPTYCRTNCASTCISGRCSDLVFVAAYLVLFTIILLLTWSHCQTTFPKKIADFDLREQVCGRVGKLPSFAQPLSDTITFWSNKLAKAKLDRTFKLTNALFVGPVSLLLSLGFLSGCSWVERLAPIHAAIMMYVMAVIDGHMYDSLHTVSLPISLSGPTDVTVAVLALGFYTIFPLVVILRLWRAQPFKSTKTCGCLCSFCAFALKLVFASSLFASLIASYEFSVKNITSCKTFPSFIDPILGLWDKHSGDMAVNAQAAARQALEFVQQLCATAWITVQEFGEKVIAAGKNLLDKKQ